MSVLRVPGAELRDALLPVGAVKVSLKPFKDLTFEGFYQYTWEDLKVDPVGSYFSTTDLAGAGATKVMLGFGSAPDTIPVGHPPLPPSNSPVGVAVPKIDAEEPSEQGQWGTALRYFAEGLGGTEFGLYFVNYHSRLPLIMANTGTANGVLVTRNYAATASYFLTYPGEHQAVRGELQHAAGPHGHRAAGRGVPPPRPAAAAGRRGVAVRGADAVAAAAGGAAAGPADRPRHAAGEHEPGGRLRVLAGDHRLQALQHHAGADDRHQGLLAACWAPTSSCWSAKSGGTTCTTCPIRACSVSRPRART